MQSDAQKIPDCTESRAAQVFGERNKAFRIIFDTVVDVAGASDDTVLPLLCRNLRSLCNAEYVELAACDTENRQITFKAMDCAEDGGRVDQSILGRSVGVMPQMMEAFGRDTLAECRDTFSLASLVGEHDYDEHTAQPTAQHYRLICKSSEGNPILVGSIRMPVGVNLKMRDLVVVYINVMEQIVQRISAVEALREKEKRYSLIIEGANMGTWDWNVQTGDLILNDRWAKMMGYSLDEIEPNISTWEALVHPADLPRVYMLLEKHFDGVIASFESEFRMKAKSGEWKWILSCGQVLERDEQGRACRAAGTHLDITKIKKAEKAIVAHAEKEKEIASCSRALLSSENSDRAINRALQHLLKASGGSRVYVFKNIQDDFGSLSMCQTHEVCCPGITTQIDNPVLQCVPYQPGFARWMDVLSKGGMIRGMVEDFPEGEQAILRDQNIDSLIVLPIQVEKEWYGFLGFDSCGMAHIWTDSEIYLLRTGAEMLGSYLERNRVARRVRLEKEKAEDATRELAEIVGELKRFNRLAVGREIKMVELKREIQALKKELGREVSCESAHKGSGGIGEEARK